MTIITRDNVNWSGSGLSGWIGTPGSSRLRRGQKWLSRLEPGVPIHRQSRIGTPDPPWLTVDGRNKGNDNKDKIKYKRDNTLILCKHTLYWGWASVCLKQFLFSGWNAVRYVFNLKKIYRYVIHIVFSSLSMQVCFYKEKSLIMWNS